MRGNCSFRLANSSSDGDQCSRTAWLSNRAQLRRRSGSCCAFPGLSAGLTASLQAISGGNVEALQQMCETARHDAFVMMMKDAVRYRANAIVGFRYDTTEIAEGLTEVLAYGTAVSAEAT